MTNPLSPRTSSGRPTIVEIVAPSIGVAWMDIAKWIMSSGVTSTYDGLRIREVVMAALIVTKPDTTDDVIERLGDRERLSWMHANFTDPREVPELGDAASYATRLYDYAGSGRDQVAWVVSTLRRDPLSRSATITTFQPLTDTSYIPCVSLLDFYLVDGDLELAVYAHSIDFGAKGYGNLVELAWIQSHVAHELHVPVGRLTMFVKSAHVYDSDDDFMTDALGKHFG